MKAIVDKNARIGRNVKVINKNKVEEANRESEGYVIRDGIIVILRGAEIPDNTVL
ncbi:Glucose-1-phosphate adenylyltransferase [Linum perenne]